MARISAAKFTNRDILVTGTDPPTGEYLSAAQRKALFRKQKISSNQVFRKPGAIVKAGSSAITPDAGAGANVNVLNVRVIAIEKQVAFLAKALDKEAELEKKSQRNYEKRVLQQEEKKLRSGEEKQLEKKLSDTLVSPVKTVGRKAGGVLGNLMEFFGILFAGWLTNQGMLALQANAEGNTEKLEEIKNRVIKDLAIVTGIFATLNGGLFAILGIIGGITARILTKPFRALFGGRKPAPAASGGGAKPQGGGLFRNAGGSRRGITTSRLTRNGVPVTRAAPVGGSGGLKFEGVAQYTRDKTFLGKTAQRLGVLRKMATRNIFKMIGLGPGSPVKKILSKLREVFPKDKAVEFAADTATKPKSLFGKIFGALGNLGKKILPLLRAAFFIGAVRDRAMQGMSPAQSILGAMFPLAGSIIGGGLGGTIGAAGGPLAFLGAFAGSWLGDFLGIQVQRLLDFVWKPGWNGAPGIKNFNEMIYSLQSEGGLGGVLQSIFPYSSQNTKPGESVESSSKSLTSSSSSSAASTSSSSSAASASSVPSIASPSSPQMQVPGPVSNAGNTTVIYKKIGSSSSGQTTSPKPSKSSTNVPLIASANPDNFYTMYSQMIYNVVI